MSEESRENQEISDEEIEKKVFDIISGSGYEKKQFIGAHIPKLDLSAKTINSEDEAPINFSHSFFPGGIDLHESVIEQDIIISHSVITNLIAIDTEFTKRAYFDGSYITENASFVRASFHSLSNFAGVNFHKIADFSVTKFTTPTFEGAAFHEGGTFFAISVAESGNFDRCYLGSTTFANAEIKGSLSFNNTSVREYVNLTSIECSEMYLGFYSSEQTLVDLTGSHLDDFYLSHSGDSNLLYNVMLAELGDGVIESKNPDFNPFYGIFFRDVSFNGFDFTSYHPELKELDWKLHTYPENFEDLIGEIGQIDTGFFESTYLKAKIGAEQVGDQKAASEFFMKELRYRRQVSWENEHYLDWTFNLLYDLIAGYGERTSRVVIVSVITVVAFAEIYGVLLPSGDRFFEHVLESYTTSIQGFVSLVFGGGTELNSLIIRFLAAIEGFLGAFLIALFVYSLTQSVRR